MANEALINAGTELILETAASSLQLLDGDFEECTSATRSSTDDAGYPLGIFEFDTASTSPFSLAPTAGAVINLYERKINSDASDAPAPVSTHKHDYLYSFPVEPQNTTQQKFTSPPLPINRSGGKYYIEWVDGGAGSESMDAGWELRLTPVTYGTA